MHVVSVFGSKSKKNEENFAHDHFHLIFSMNFKSIWTSRYKNFDYFNIYKSTLLPKHFRQNYDT